MELVGLVVLVLVAEVVAATEVDEAELDVVVARRTEEEFGCGMLVSELAVLVVLVDGGHVVVVEVVVVVAVLVEEEVEEEVSLPPAAEVSTITFSSPLLKSRARCTTLKVPSPM